MPIQLTLRHSANLILIKKGERFRYYGDLHEKPSAKNDRLRIRSSLAAVH
jgi:hypothetical protein